MASHLRLNPDDNYDVTDSEDENYSAYEKELLKKVKNRNTQDSESEEELFGVNVDSDNSSNLALSDIEGNDEGDDGPNVHAWGKKRWYYDADYVDQDYGTYLGKDAEQADNEEQEAKLIEKDLLEGFKGSDFVFSKIKKANVASEDKSAINKLSKEEREVILSDKTNVLIREINDKLKTVEFFLIPMIKYSAKNKMERSKALEFVEEYYKIIMQYFLNINVFILLLNELKVFVRNHPIMKTLFDLRKIIEQMDSVFEKIIKPQIESLLNNEEIKNKTREKLSLVVNNQIEISKATNKSKTKEKSVKFNSNVQVKVIERLDNIEESSSEEEKDQQEEEENEPMETEDEEARRAITYQISKNKGLTPHRNKMQRNPRVKYRIKYKQALKRRKGAVREVRKELKRYDGELSGIKASVIKSIKFKS